MTDTNSEMLRVELDFVPGVEPIRGRARDADGVEHAFAGWLELVEVLDEARMGRRAGGTGRSKEPRR
ncbi:hypothetical protein ACGFNU_23790 [Spirillospora sp. NPDC048911]|uniref:hypothetical protein n=1 Tax=Spirillospora sp. NPDC048911 TaxID=3364527 RepID=UPI0037113D6E